KASPSPETSVLALDDAAAITSAYLPASLASSPKALMESVKISDTRPKSSPDAAARFSTPSIPSKDCCTSQPASDMYLKPSVTSFALNLVDAPSSRALVSSCCNSAPVAPLKACTSDKPALKSMPILAATPPTAINGAVTFIDN